MNDKKKSNSQLLMFLITFLINIKNEEKNNKSVRKTHCFHCKENINSQQWDACDACKGIVCSCGACFCSWEGHRYEI